MSLLDAAEEEPSPHSRPLEATRSKQARVVDAMFTKESPPMRPRPWPSNSLSARVWRTAVAAGLGIALCGCVSLVPKAKPAQLYTFASTPSAQPIAAPKTILVVLDRLQFVRASRSDGIVTRRGAQIASVARARWVSPADVLFTEALARAFDVTHAGLVRQGATRGAARLSVRVTAFEAVYDTPQSPPMIVISANAILSPSNGKPAQLKRFSVSQPAAQDRLAMIVEAFAVAVDKVTGDIALWTAANAPAPPI